MDGRLTFLVILFLVGVAILPGSHGQQSTGFFSLWLNSWANLFRRNNNNTSSNTSDIYDLAPSIVQITTTVYGDPTYLTETYTETMAELSTTTEVSTMTLSWIRFFFLRNFIRNAELALIFRSELGGRL